MLSAANITGTIKNAFSDVLRLTFGRVKTASLFNLYATIANKTNAIVNEINSGMVDSGVK
jgi:hypothetical protein